MKIYGRFGIIEITRAEYYGVNPFEHKYVERRRPDFTFTTPDGVELAVYFTPYEEEDNNDKV